MRKHWINFLVSICGSNFWQTKNKGYLNLVEATPEPFSNHHARLKHIPLEVRIKLTTPITPTSIQHHVCDHSLYSKAGSEKEGEKQNSVIADDIFVCIDNTKTLLISYQVNNLNKVLVILKNQYIKMNFFSENWQEIFR